MGDDWNTDEELLELDFDSFEAKLEACERAQKELRAEKVIDRWVLVKALYHTEIWSGEMPQTKEEATRKKVPSSCWEKVKKVHEFRERHDPRGAGRLLTPCSSTSSAVFRQRGLKSTSASRPKRLRIKARPIRTSSGSFASASSQMGRKPKRGCTGVARKSELCCCFPRLLRWTISTKGRERSGARLEVYDDRMWGLVALIVFFGVVAALVGGGGGQETPVEEKEKEAGVEEVVGEPEEEPAKQEPARQDNTGTLTVRVTGTPGIPFSGSYGTLEGQRTVDGVTPAEYEVEVETGLFAVDSVSAVMQKQSQDQSELRVEIVDEDGEVVAQQDTTAAFGVASINYSPNQR